MQSPAHTALRVLPADTPARFTAAVEQAARQLRAGEVVALPTETVYGLAANALSAQAVERIFKIKGRPLRNPIIVHVCDVAMARQCVAAWPPLAERLARAFWPGPLTLVLPRAPAIPPVVTAGGDTVGVRWPSHPLIQAVIRACGFPLAAPSANLSNRLSPTNAQHVRQQLAGRLSLIIDGGQSQVGIESTVLDLTGGLPRILRPGMIHETALLAVTGKIAVGETAGGDVLRSPGLLCKHYAPRARLVLWSWENETELQHQAGHFNPGIRTHVIAHTHIPSGRGFERVSVIPHDPVAFARAIYAELHACDQAGAELIIVEAPPQNSEWRAVIDRLTRASA